MSYTKQNFVKDQILTADHLNHIEDGIEATSNNIETISNDLKTKADTDHNHKTLSIKTYSGGGNTTSTYDGTNTLTLDLNASAVGLSGLSSSSNELKYSGSNSGGSRVSLGYNNTVTGSIAIGLGQENKVTGENSLGLGYKNVCTTHEIYMIGYENKVVNSDGYNWSYSFAFGEKNSLGFKEGDWAGDLPTNAEAVYGSVALGRFNYLGQYCNAVGQNNYVKNESTAVGSNCHANKRSTAVGSYCRALSSSSIAVGNSAYAGGEYSSSFGHSSRAEAGYTLAMGYCGYARKYRAIAIGGDAKEEESLAVGSYANAYNKCSAALTPHTYAAGENAVCVGYAAETNAKNAMAIGYKTKVGETGEGVTAMGHFNDSDVTGCSTGTTGTALVIGNGASDNARSNACRITFAGAVIGKAAYQSSGADYAEYFEWLDGNTDSEDRRGYFVTMDGNKIKKAKEGDYILGIVSAYPAVIGNNDMEWSGKFLLDEFGDPIKKVQKTIIKEHELIKDVHFTDEEMQTLTDEERKQREMKEVEKEVECEYFVLNPDFDPNREYVHRADRPEWDTIGMLGVLTVYDDGTCQVNGFCKCNNDGIATACERGFDTYRVIERVNENLVKVVFK